MVAVLLGKLVLWRLKLQGWRARATTTRRWQLVCLRVQRWYLEEAHRATLCVQRRRRLWWRERHATMRLRLRVRRLARRRLSRGEVGTMWARLLRQLRARRAAHRLRNRRRRSTHCAMRTRGTKESLRHRWWQRHLVAAAMALAITMAMAMTMALAMTMAVALAVSVALAAAIPMAMEVVRKAVAPAHGGDGAQVRLPVARWCLMQRHVLRLCLLRAAVRMTRERRQRSRHQGEG